MLSKNEQAFIKIRDLISEGELRPGERLVEDKMVGMVKIGRTPIREALRRLEAEGYVDILPNRGAIVKKISIGELRETYDLIAVLEGRAVEITTNYIQKLDRKKLNAIQRVLEGAAKENDHKTWVEYNAQFHFYFLDKSQEVVIRKIANQLRRSASRYRFISGVVPGSLQRYLRAHKHILKAVFDGQSKKAGRLMREHILDARERLIEFFEQMIEL